MDLSIYKKEWKETPVLVITKSPVKHIKKSRETKEPWSDIFGEDVYIVKKQKMLIGASYKDLLKRFDLLTEEKAKTDERVLPWGQWVKNSNVLIEHKGNFYLRLYSFSEDTPEIKYVFEDNEPVPEDKLKRLSEFKQKSKPSDKRFKVQTVKISSIKTLKVLDK